MTEPTKLATIIDERYFLEFLETAERRPVPFWPEQPEPPEGGYPPVVVPPDVTCTHEQTQWKIHVDTSEFRLTCLRCEKELYICEDASITALDIAQPILQRPRLWFEEHPPPPGEYTPKQEDYDDMWADDIDLEMPKGW